MKSCGGSVLGAVIGCRFSGVTYQSQAGMFVSRVQFIAPRECQITDFFFVINTKFTIIVKQRTSEFYVSISVCQTKVEREYLSLGFYKIVFVSSVEFYFSIISF